MVRASRVRSALVVARQVSFYPVLCLADAVVAMERALFVCDTPPAPFHTDVITPAACAIPADLDAVVCQQPSEFQAGELQPGSVLKITGLP